jgi:hypothetical protein
MALEINGLDVDPIEGFGKKLRKGLKKATKPVKKIVRKAAPVVGLAANIIPGVGQVASAAILTAAAVDKQRRSKKRAKRAAQADAVLAAEVEAGQMMHAAVPRGSAVPMAFDEEGYGPAGQTLRAQELPDGEMDAQGAPPPPVKPTPWYKQPAVLTVGAVGILGAFFAFRR